MPRLPGPQDLGALPSMRPAGRPAQISGSSPMADAVGRIGQGMVALSSEQQQRDEAIQAAEADARLTTGLAEVRRRFETDPDYETFEPRFQEEAARVRAEASALIRSPNLLRRWSPRADVAVSGSLDSVLGRGRGLRAEAEYDRLDRVLGDLGTQYVRATDDDTRATLMRSIEDSIELGRRTGIVSPSRLRELRQRHLHGVVEADADARLLAGDGFAALLELREGDARATVPSTGQVSELGVSNIQRLLRRVNPPPQNQTPAQAQAELRRLRTEAGRVSEWMGANLVGQDGQPIALTQLQHDALVGYALSRRGGSPQDALSELLPSLQSGNWESVSAAVRAGSLSALEQPSAPGAPSTSPPGRARPIPRFAPDVDSAIVSAAQQHGIDPDLMRRVAAIESAGNPRAVTGSYRGLFQLSAEEFGGRGDTFNAADNANAAAANFVRHIANFRQQHGRDPTAGELYLIHQQGAGGFAAHMAQPGRLAWESMASTAEGRQRGNRWARQAISGNLPPDVLARLGGVDRITSQQFMDYWRGRVEGGTPSGPGAPAPASGDQELGDMVLGRAPSSRYAGLPFDRRQVVIRRLSEGLRTEATEQANLDIASIRQTGEPRRLPDGSSWLDRVPHVMTRMQADRIARLAREARAQFEAIRGLSDATPDQMAERLDSISSIGDAQDGTTPALRPYVARVVEGITQLRQNDPALWASGAFIAGQRGSVRAGADGQLHAVPAQEDLRIQPAPEVARAHELLARRYASTGLRVVDGELVIADPASPTGQARPQRLLLTDERLTPEDRRLIIEARQAAMARVGIPEGDRRVLRSDEAALLLNLPARLDGLPPDDLRRRLQQAADRATALFGPQYARAAYLDAVRFRRLTGENLRAAESAGYGLQGHAMEALAREEALWRGGGPVAGFVHSGIQFPGASSFFGGEGPPSLTVPGGQTLPGAFSMAPPGGELEPMAGIPRFGSVGGAPGAPSVGLGARAWLNQEAGIVAPQTSAQSWPRPQPEDIQALVSRPGAHQRLFDQTFGPGAAARYLQLWRQQGQ